MKYLILTILVTVSGCASFPKISQEGARVRLVRSTPHNCKFVSTVDAEKPAGIVNDVFDNYAAGMDNILKNNAAMLGANTVEVTSYDKFYRQGEAYFCDYNDTGKQTIIFEQAKK